MSTRCLRIDNAAELTLEVIHVVPGRYDTSTHTMAHHIPAVYHPESRQQLSAPIAMSRTARWWHNHRSSTRMVQQMAAATCTGERQSCSLMQRLASRPRLISLPVGRRARLRPAECRRVLVGGRTVMDGRGEAFSWLEACRALPRAPLRCVGGGYVEPGGHGWPGSAPARQAHALAGLAMGAWGGPLSRHCKKTTVGYCSNCGLAYE